MKIKYEFVIQKKKMMRSIGELRRRRIGLPSSLRFKIIIEKLNLLFLMAD